MVSRTHLAALADLRDRVRLVGVLSRRRDRADAFAKAAAAVLDHPVDVYDHINAIAADPAVDFALILTPPDARIQAVQRLSAAGKHILMEKPVERSAAAAREIVDICAAADIRLGIVFQHRTRAASRELSRLVAEGSLGDLIIAEAHVPWWRDQAYYDEPGRGTYARDGGGVLISQAIHTLDLMLSLTGPVARVQAMAHTTGLHRMEAEDYVTAALLFANGAAGSIIASTASFPGGVETLSFQFTHAAVRLGGGLLCIDWHDGRQERFGVDAATGGGADPMGFTHEWHRDVIADFIDAITDKRDPLVTGRMALNVHLLIEAIIASSHDGRLVTL